MNIATIQQRIHKIEEYKEEIKKAKNILDDQITSHPAYELANKKTKEAAAEKKRIKEEIYAKTENDKLVWEIKENKEEISTLEEILAGELVEFYQTSKTDKIPDVNGEERKFKISIKLSPRKNG